MRRIITGIFILSLSLALKSQVDRAGTVIKISGGEITVRNENPAEPFVMGETLRLLTGDKSVVLQVTFAMQSSAKCKLISGSVGSLKIGSLVYSGGIPESSGGNAVKSEYNSNINPGRIEEFNNLIGFRRGDQLNKAVRLFGSPTKINKGDGSGASNDSYYWFDDVESGRFIIFYSDFYSGDVSKIKSMALFSFDGSRYVDTSVTGTIHFLRAKGLRDSALDLFGSTPEEIKRIFGKPERTDGGDGSENYSYWYRTSSGNQVAFYFYPGDDKVYFIFVYFT